LGVAGLKHFLEFARNGRMTATAEQVKKNTEDTDIIESVAREIRTLGYEVDTQVGRSEVKIDLAVLDPNDQGRYMLGIICDGTRYYETKTERDREICQPGVLEGLGWKLMRLWTVDWLMNKEAVMDRIKKCLTEKPASKEEKSKEAVKTATPKANTAASPLPFAVNADEIVKPKALEKPAILNKIEAEGSKPIDKMKREDIEEIVRFAVEQQVAIPLDDLKRQASKMMGYPRRTPKIDAAIELAIAMLIDKGVLTEEGGNMMMK
jgi:very-short-patch-repair endonuclease